MEYNSAKSDCSSFFGFQFAGRVKISGLPFPEIRASLKKNILGSSMKGLLTTWIMFNLKNMKIRSLFSSLLAIKHTTEQ